MAVESKRYLEVAEQAAQAEREGAYKLASELWQGAMALTQTKQNYEWAKTRMKFCQYRIH